ncbi:MAG TPA: hypothetical protein DDY14_14410 [Chromatiaceae bacterium]|jgi:hypothetical protein|nr:MAG: hypothetical protein N838_31995 [Thiohalocapsa sp. PB-PSB1]HBG96473.1 hypothetical protein [Chromatiaceae bacterium]
MNHLLVAVLLVFVLSAPGAALARSPGKLLVDFAVAVGAALFVEELQADEEHENVVRTRDGKLKPAPGYTWLTEQEDDFRVRWDPGKEHSSFPNVLASDDEKVWKPRRGYKWVSEDDNDLRVIPKSNNTRVDTYAEYHALPSSQRWLIIASRPTEQAATSFARKYRRTFSNTKVFLSQNGWYAITLGPMEYPHAESSRVRWIQQSMIPSDAFFSSGTPFSKEVSF